MYYQEWELDTPDQKTIYGVTDYFKNADELSDKVLVIVHGLTGHRDEYHIKGAADFFAPKGYDVIRFNLYDGPNGRRLRDTTLQTYAADLNLVLNAKTQNYKKLFIAGRRSDNYDRPTNTSNSAVFMGSNF